MKIDNASFPRGIIEALCIDEAATAIRISHYNKDVGEEDRELRDPAAHHAQAEAQARAQGGQEG